ncbi:hypothetical protein [Chitinophaga sp. MM2321]|uniref:hypothetical protein n=1 Tax=Chitinophaga sp. MM2321 TaxID=3137178 RepID=UPI0032D59FA3
MKHVNFVLAPKAVTLVLATILTTVLHSTAQEKPFAYNATRYTHEQPAATPAKKTCSFEISQLEKNSLLFKLTVDNPENEKLTLYIKDKFNNILHREMLPVAARFDARYNLQSLEDGEYVFEIKNGKNRITEKEIEIKTQTVVNRSVSM